MQAHLHDMLIAIPVLSVNIEHFNTQHRAIVDAILPATPAKARQMMEGSIESVSTPGRSNSVTPAKARQMMERHCDDTAALLRGLLK